MLASKWEIFPQRISHHQRKWSRYYLHILRHQNRLYTFTLGAAKVTIHHCNKAKRRGRQPHHSCYHFDTMRKFFDSRRELVSSGPGSGGGGGGSSSGSSHAGGNFIGRAFTVGRHQVTVEEIIAEGENRGVTYTDQIMPFISPFLYLYFHFSSRQDNQMPFLGIAPYGSPILSIKIMI